MKKILIVIIFLPLFSMAQGIKFEEGLSWEQVKQKAKAENKYIFVDAYATWCAPCKLMDNNVYNQDSVGNIINQKFICLKLQIDETDHDNNEVKRMHPLSQKFKNDYSVKAFPTYLFFTNEGKLIHRETGYKLANQFLKITADATDSTTQYYTLLEKYQRGELNYLKMPNLSMLALKLGDREIADSVALDCINNYLLINNKDELFTKDNLAFLATFTRKEEDKGFAFFDKNRKRIDEVMGEENLSRSILDRIITSAYVSPFMKMAGKNKDVHLPWDDIGLAIEKKYGSENAKRIIAKAKYNWYGYTKNWEDLAKTFFHAIKTSTTDHYSDWELNIMAWHAVFFVIEDKEKLTIAINLMSGVVDRNPRHTQILDTYANLLHKVGRTKEGIEYEIKALSISPDDKSFQDRLLKMKNNLPTWIKESK